MMPFGHGLEERRNHQRVLPAADLYAVAAGCVGRILNIGRGGLAFSYVLLQEAPLDIDRLDILYGGEYLLRDLPVQALNEHRLDNKFATSLVEVRRCRIVFGTLTEEQQRQVAALIGGRLPGPAAPILAFAAG